MNSQKNGVHAPFLYCNIQSNLAVNQFKKML